VTFKWQQVSGAAVTLSNATAATASFTAPTIAMGAPNQALVFKLTVTPASGAPAVDSRFVTVTVAAPPDTAAPNVAAPTVQQGTTTLRRGQSTTLTTTATDNVGVTSVTFFYSYTQNGVKQTGTVTAARQTTPANTWKGSFIPSTTVPSNTTYTFTAVASDAAGNQATSGSTAKSFQ